MLIGNDIATPFGRPRRIDSNQLARPTFAQLGDQRSVRYVTRPEDCVRGAGTGREWSEKPAVIASCAVIRLCEEVCMAALLENISEGFSSLGTRQVLDHLGPIAVGAEIEISARCRRVDGSYSSWDVTVADDFEIVGKGCMDFVVVHRLRFEAKRLDRKYLAIALDAGLAWAG